MKGLIAVASLIMLGLAGLAWAQLSAPNGAGVAMGHLHYHVRDVAANKKFWVALGAQPAVLGATEVMTFPGVLILLTPGPSSGGTNGSVVNHVAFRVQSFANMNFSGSAMAQAPTRGRMLDHIGFEIRNLERFCRRLDALGVKLDLPYTKGSTGVATALLTDPWGTSIELTEGLDRL
jgi:catechol 2,3-dioxygenase-like lactoylglutathione lyase family enzyme